MKRFRRCVVHIGTEKTGTTTIQKFLANNRAALAADGIVYASATGQHGGTQCAFVAVARDLPIPQDMGEVFAIATDADREAFSGDFSARLETEFAAAPGAHTWIISSEHLHSRVRSVPEMIRLRNFLARWADEIEVLLYLRRQDRVAISSYATKVKAGEADPTVFVPTGGARLPYYFDYEAIHGNWAQAFGRSAMRVRLFERNELSGGDLLQDFCEASGIRREGKREPPVLNEALNCEGLDFLLALNRLMPNRGDPAEAQVRAEIVRLVSRTHQGKCVMVPRQRARQFYLAFHESNERLKALVFPDRRKPLFDQDFSAYPEKMAPRAPSHDAAVGVAIRMMQTLAADRAARKANAAGQARQQGQGAGRPAGQSARPGDGAAGIEVRPQVQAVPAPAGGGQADDASTAPGQGASAE